MHSDERPESTAGYSGQPSDGHPKICARGTRPWTSLIFVCHEPLISLFFQFCSGGGERERGDTIPFELASGKERERDLAVAKRSAAAERQRDPSCYRVRRAEQN